MSDAALAVDVAAIPAGTNEELAGPPEATRPVQRAERVGSVDVLRGFALLGILLMNITSFGLPSWAYAIPLSTPLPVFSGPHSKANTIAWFLRWILAEGKMRALFSMLFGAGVILLTERAEKRGAGIRAADIYTRRNIWLVIFGILHAYLIWEGDILYWYGMTALLFMFPFRKLQPKTLIWCAAIIMLISGPLLQGGGFYARSYFSKKKADAANVLLAQHKVLTEDQVEDLKNWKDIQEEYRPTQKKLDKDVKAMRGGWASAQGHQAGDVLKAQTMFYYFGFGDVLAFMLLGMAMFRNGFMAAQWSMKAYAITALVGLGVAWPVTYLGCLHAYQSHFDMFVTIPWLNGPYELGRVGGALGNAAVLLLLFKSGTMQWLLKALSNVGQMALSNYLLTSISMKFLFVWGPWKWYGRMEYYRLYEVVFCMWIVNMIWSTIWLKYFLFGPFEWVWRSLTYWKRQPMLRQPLETGSKFAPPEPATA